MTSKLVVLLRSTNQRIQPDLTRGQESARRPPDCVHNSSQIQLTWQGSELKTTPLCFDILHGVKYWHCFFRCSPPFWMSGNTFPKDLFLYYILTGGRALTFSRKKGESPPPSIFLLSSKIFPKDQFFWKYFDRRTRNCILSKKRIAFSFTSQLATLPNCTPMAIFSPRAFRGCCTVFVQYSTCCFSTML